MENLTKIPYEISLWDDRLTLVDENGKEHGGFVDASQIQVVDQYYKEYKLCVIGSDTMNSAFGVVDPSLVRKTDGTSTLTFSIYAKYYDEESGELKDNPFMKYLTNERKVKLKFYPNGELRWLDFIIKKIDESSENYKFSYTATDLFINELSKTGYNLEFDIELENNQGTVVELANKILAHSDWTVGMDNELLQEIKEEPLYKIKLEGILIAKDIFTNEVVQINPDEYIYTFYSTLNESDDPEFFQFIYDGKTEDENGKIHHKADENHVLQDVKYLYCARADISGLDNYVYYPGFRGQKYIRSQKNEYDKVLDEYVKVYEDEAGQKVYGYVKTEYFTPNLVTNYITNGQRILSSTGWDQMRDGTVEVEMYPLAGQPLKDGESRKFGLKYEQTSDSTKPNKYLLNSGFRDNAETIKEITPSNKFVFRINVKKVDNDSLSDLDEKKDEYFGVRVYRCESGNAGNPIPGAVLFEGIANKRIDSEGDFYYIDNLTPKYSVSYEELTDINRDDKFYIEIKATKDGTYFIQQAELFAQHSGKSSEDEENPENKTEVDGIILPDGKVMSDSEISTTIAQSQIKYTYYYYLAKETEEKAKGGNGKIKPEEISYLYIGEEKQEENYKPVYDYTFEKVRSISKKESNRFDLLQTLSENFKCWCRFDVWHKETGEIMLAKDYVGLIDGGDSTSVEKIIFLGGTAYSIEDLSITMSESEFTDFGYGPYQQLKFVTFHNKIGQKKNFGFRYGINLKSISRSLDSNTIATKLIVKSNTNEFANGGSCNIALAKENPTGENFIYDFTYYIKQGLLNETNLERDLYYWEDESFNERQGWIGLYVKLRALNNQRDALATELVGLTTQYSNVKSNQEYANLLHNTSEEELRELKDKYHDTTGESYNGSIPEGYEDNSEVEGYIYNIELYESQIKQTEEDSLNAKAQLVKLDSRIKELNEELKEIEKTTAELIARFETKYIRYVQEASWTSEDYVDDNLYYLDAETTLHKSAQPKVSYTINVIELSQLEEYKNYVFDLGDITYIQDPDFFGWEQGEKYKTPHKEEIVITEMQTFFHNPEKSTIKVQNYRSSFDDLFKKLTASAQQVQFHSGEFQRAADIVDANGNIAPSCLEDAFSSNMFALQNAGNQSVKWDETGITTTDTTKPAEITRITSGGIFLTDTGGEKWTTGITAKGINAKVITTGALNTGLVNIYNGSQKSFVWDSQGINAYRQKKNGGYSQSSYVRFNQEGLKAQENGNETFSLTDEGLSLSKGTISIQNKDNGILIDPLLTKRNNENDIGTVLSIRANNKNILSVDGQGNAVFSGVLSAATGDFTGTIHAKAGGDIAGWYIDGTSITKVVNIETEGNTYRRVSLGSDPKYPAFFVTASSSFEKQNCITYIDWDGTLLATKANITGDITAKNLTILNNAQVSGLKADQIGDLNDRVNNIWANNVDALTISANQINGGTISGVAFESSNGLFKVGSNGIMECVDAKIHGEITAKEGGNIGGWIITNGSLMDSSVVYEGGCYYGQNSEYYWVDIYTRNRILTTQAFQYEILITLPKKPESGMITDPSFRTSSELLSYYGVSEFGKYKKIVVPWTLLYKPIGA